MVMLMAVVPEFSLVEQEEKNQAAQHRGQQPGGRHIAFKRFGQKQGKGGGQQGARRQAEHVLGVAGQQAKAQQSGKPNAADTGQRGGQKDGGQGHSFMSFGEGAWLRPDQNLGLA
jgi:hypothetical protein